MATDHSSCRARMRRTDLWLRRIPRGHIFDPLGQLLTFFARFAYTRRTTAYTASSDYTSVCSAARAPRAYWALNYTDKVAEHFGKRAFFRKHCFLVIQLQLPRLTYYHLHRSFSFQRCVASNNSSPSSIASSVL